MKFLVFVYNGFSEYEVSLACQFLAHHGEIITVGIDKEVIIGEAKFKIIPDITFTNLQAKNYDAIIISGSMDFSDYLNATEVFSFLQKMNKENKVLAAICGGPFFLGRAGVLKGKKYTCNILAEDREELGVFKDGEFVDIPAITDENIITAQGFATVDFAVSLGDRLGLFTSSGHKKRFEDFWKKGKI